MSQPRTTGRKAKDGRAVTVWLSALEYAVLAAYAERHRRSVSGEATLRVLAPPAATGGAEPPDAQPAG